MSEALIEIRDLCKIYNPGEVEVRALDHVSLTINRGELVAIIGQSGSGKSTLMNQLGCLDVPTSGDYFLSGQNVAKLSDNELSDIRNREIGFIFQGFNLIPNLTAVENVEVPLIYRGIGKRERRQLAISSLEKVGLGHRLDHKPSQMSGGRAARCDCAGHRRRSAVDSGGRTDRQPGFRVKQGNPANFKTDARQRAHGHPDYA